MSMEMAMPCPECEHGGPHPITAAEYGERINVPLVYVLHCNKCEKVWEERMRWSEYE